MKTARIRVELNKGRRGIPLNKLSRITAAFFKFLQKLSVDIGAAEESEQWLAERFENNSVDFDCLNPRLHDEARVGRCHRALRYVMNNDLSDDEMNITVRRDTKISYYSVTDYIDDDEDIKLGLYGNGSDTNPTEWFLLNKMSVSLVDEIKPENPIYHGEAQGIVHAFYKESKHPKLVIRELSTGNLIDCFFDKEMYQSAVETLQDPESVLFVEGEVVEDGATGNVISITASDFRLAPEFKLAEFESMIGKFPEAITGGKSMEEFLELARGE